MELPNWEKKKNQTWGKIIFLHIQAYKKLRIFQSIDHDWYGFSMICSSILCNKNHLSQWIKLGHWKSLLFNKSLSSTLYNLQWIRLSQTHSKDIQSTASPPITGSAKKYSRLFTTRVTFLFNISKKYLLTPVVWEWRRPRNEEQCEKISA